MKLQVPAPQEGSAAVAEECFTGAEPLSQNRYKLGLGKTLVKRALEQLLGG